jgi:hypothetical protein
MQQVYSHDPDNQSSKGFIHIYPPLSEFQAPPDIAYRYLVSPLSLVSITLLNFPYT